MITVFTATIKVKVTHKAGTHIDENSVKGLAGAMILSGRENAYDVIREAKDMTRSPETVEITLSQLATSSEVGETIDISDINRYL